jgi:hypothetical protein
MFDFEHINLNEVDDSRQTVEPNVYTFEINKLEPVYREVKNPSSPYAGQKVLVIRGSYTIADDEKFSGRKIWQDFWTPFKVPQIFLKRQMQATGITQADGETLGDWANQFSLLSPPARFQAPLKLEKDNRDPEGPSVNRIDFYNARAAA